MQKQRILIVGAGLAGLALYRSLDKKKFDIDLIERRPSFENLGYEVLFMPNGVRALRKLGFPARTVNSLGKPVRELVVRNDRGEVTHVADVANFHKKYDRYLVVSREELHSLLETGVGRKVVLFSTEPSSIALSKEGVRVRFKGERTVRHYDLVVGADGVNSFVRKTLFPSAKLKSLGAWIIWAWLPRLKTRIGERTVAFTANKRGIGYFDTGHGKRICAFFWAETDILPKKTNRQSYARLWREYLDTFDLSSIEATNSVPEQKDMFAHEDGSLDLRSWSKGRVVLIGDAAHARGVFTGSGTALAVEDGYLLGSYLNESESVTPAVKRFCSVQQPRVRKMVPTLIGPAFVRMLEEFFSSSALFSAKR